MGWRHAGRPRPPVGGLLHCNVGYEVPQGQVDVVEVVAPLRPEAGMEDQWARVPRRRRDPEPLAPCESWHWTVYGDGVRPAHTWNPGARLGRPSA